MTAIVLDTETTGFSPHDDRITELAIMRLNGEILFHELINPGRPIPEEITAITGITNERVAGLPTFDHWAKGVANIISQFDAMIGHNVFFDRRMLARELSRCSIDVQWPTAICTKRVWDIHEPKESRKLENAYKRFVDPEGFDGAHSAAIDTEACRRVFLAQQKMFRLDGVPWEDIDPEAKKWWGATDHIIWSDDNLLLVNFGKHKGKHVGEVDTSYWRWVAGPGQNFPDHVQELADFITHISREAGEIADWARTK